MSQEARQYALLRLGVIGGWFGSLAVLWFVVARQFQVLAGPASDCGCAMTPIQWPVSVIVGTGLVVLVASLLTVRFAGAMFSRIIRHRRLVSRWHRHGRSIWFEAVQRSVLVVADNREQAMTIGLFQPKIVITRGLVRRLNQAEVASVLRHEQAHAEARDPLSSLLLESIGATVGWQCGVRHIVNAAFNLRELVADGIATDNYSQVHDLSAAMYKVATAATPQSLPAFSPNSDRISKLLDSSWQLPIRWWSWRAALATSIVVVGLLGATHLPTATAAAQPVMPPEACWLRQQMCTRPAGQVLLMTPDAAMSSYGW